MEYIYIICPVIALLTCQILKCLIEWIETKKFSLARLTNGSGECLVVILPLLLL